MANCTSCGREVQDWEQTYYDSFQVCSDCYRRKFSAGGKTLLCTGCSRRIDESEANRSLGTTLCSECYSKEMKRRAEWVCSSCHKDIHYGEEKFRSPEGKTLCRSCMEKNSKRPPSGPSAWGKCHRCGKKTADGILIDEDKVYCKNCAIDHMNEEKELEQKHKGKEGLGSRLRHIFGEQD